MLNSAAASAALAWGRQGHRVAGALGERLLDTNARQHVHAILGAEPLAQASYWADTMRADPAPFWQEVAGPLHYVTVPASGAYSPAKAPPEGDAYTALSAFARDILDPTSTLPQKQLALRFAVHIIQDLQQPLHAGGRNDRGGNDFAVIVDQERSNLHRVWDVHLLAGTGRSDGQWLTYLQRAYPADQMRAWQSNDPLLWIGESYALSAQLYPPSPLIGDDYRQRWLPVAERRLAQAGVRTASFLNALFAGHAPPAAPQAPGRSLWQRLKDFF